MDIVSNLQRKLPYDFFTDLDVRLSYVGTPDQRYGLVKRAISSGEIFHLRRGLYYLSESHRRHPMNRFSLAQVMYAPSYISLETALAYHGWIPEAVHTVLSVGARRPREWATPLGHFRYERALSHPLFSGVAYEASESGPYLMASPWKALADYVALHNKTWRGVHPLIHSLRIEEEMLGTATSEVLAEIESAYPARRMQRFFAGVRKDLHL